MRQDLLGVVVNALHFGNADVSAHGEGVTIQRTESDQVEVDHLDSAHSGSDQLGSHMRADSSHADDDDIRRFDIFEAVFAEILPIAGELLFDSFQIVLSFRVDGR